MDFLNTAIAQVTDLFRSMTLGARITAGLLLAVVVISLVYLFNHQMSGAEVYLLGGHSFSAGEMPAVQAALSEAGLNDFEVEGSRIRVPRGKQAAYVAALAEGQALPTNWGDYLRRAVEAGTPFTTQKERDERLKIAKEQELSLVLRSMKDVINATVQYDSQKRPGFGAARESTAMVAVELVGNRLLDDQRVQMIRHLVAGAWAGLSPDRVTVADLSSGRVHAPSSDGLGSGHDHRYIAAMEAFKKGYERDVLNALSYVPGATVSAHVELHEKLRTSIEQIKHDPKSVALRIREESTTSNSEQVPRGGAPGLSSQLPNAPARIVEANKGSTSEEERTVREEENLVNRDRTVTDEIGLTPKRVTVSIGIPSSYFEKVYRDRHPTADGAAPQPPDPAVLAQIEAEETAKIRSAVAIIIPKPADAAAAADAAQLVQVTKFQHIAAPPAPLPSASEKALTWAGEHWSTLGMIGLVAVSLVMLRSLLRSAPAQPKSLELALGDASSAPGAAAATEKGGEPPKSRLRRKAEAGMSLRDELVDMIREDPDAAANILRGWIGTAT